MPHTTPRIKRTIVFTGIAIMALVIIDVAGWIITSARSDGGGVSYPPAAVALPTPSASGSSSAPPPEGWTVARARAKVPVYKKPGAGGAIKLYLPAHSRYGVDNVMLIREVREVDGHIWYNVWLPLPPNGNRGWITPRQVSLYAAHSKIVLDRSERLLRVVRDGQVQAEFDVAVGAPDLPTPTGHFYLTEKLRPNQKNGPYGVLALALSAFQPKLSSWVGGGQVAIHGTNQPQLIGQPVSHGCVRMTNEDILEVSRLVKTGSPVIIVP